MLLNVLTQVINPTNLEAVLAWIVSGVGAAYLSGRVVSLLLENLAFWHKLKPEVKLLITMVMSIAISVGAQLLLANTELVEQFSPWFMLTMQAVLAWLGSQQQYLAVKRAAGGDYGIKK